MVAGEQNVIQICLRRRPTDGREASQEGGLNGVLWLGIESFLLQLLDLKLSVRLEAFILDSPTFNTNTRVHTQTSSTKGLNISSSYLSALILTKQDRIGDQNFKWKQVILHQPCTESLQTIGFLLFLIFSAIDNTSETRGCQNIDDIYNDTRDHLLTHQNKIFSNALEIDWALNSAGPRKHLRRI